MEGTIVKSMKLRSSIFAIVTAILLVCAPSLRAQDGLLGASAQRIGTAHLAPDFEQQLAAADFDNDQKPDGAMLLPAGLLNGKRSFRIEVHVTSGNDDAIVFSAAEQSLSISAFDVNKDGAPDIVIEKPFTGQRVQVYLNDGHGAFHKARGDPYAVADSSAHKFQAWFTQLAPSSWALASGFQLAGLSATWNVRRDQARSSSSWPEKLLLHSGLRSPSHSRAPPSLLPL
jgi:hypothetical protein